MSKSQRDTHPPHRLSTILSGLAIVIAPLLIFVVKFPNHNRMFRELQDAGHAIIFGVVAIGCLNIISRWGSRWLPQRLPQYLMALLIASGIGLLMEFIQMIGPRDASMVDLILDVVGAIAFLGIVASFDRQLNYEIELVKRFRRSVFVASILILSGAFVTPAVWAYTYFMRERAMPVLATFESNWEDRLIVAMRSSIDYVDPPEQFKAEAGEKVARIKLHPKKNPGLEIWEPSPNWTNYNWLMFDILLERETNLTLAVRIQDFAHNQQYDDRFNHQFDLHQGLNSLKIDLSEVSKAPAGRLMDMKRIVSIMFFTEQPADTTLIYLDHVRLE